ncbi:uncharacterized protein LOC142485032 isoform X1 [Ascaphus truei]|uniref:uncharacterized protein LOC142485031 n=1 Tax=Ascaphus truei TaxID=8439 RepID=UPI003F5A488E
MESSQEGGLDPAITAMYEEDLRREEMVESGPIEGEVEVEIMDTTGHKKGAQKRSLQSDNDVCTVDGEGKSELRQDKVTKSKFCALDLSSIDGSGEEEQTVSKGKEENKKLDREAQETEEKAGPGGASGKGKEGKSKCKGFVVSGSKNESSQGIETKDDKDCQSKVEPREKGVEGKVKKVSGKVTLKEKMEQFENAVGDVLFWVGIFRKQHGGSSDEQIIERLEKMMYQRKHLTKEQYEELKKEHVQWVKIKEARGEVREKESSESNSSSSQKSQISVEGTKIQRSVSGVSGNESEEKAGKIGIVQAKEANSAGDSKGRSTQGKDEVGLTKEEVLHNQLARGFGRRYWDVKEARDGYEKSVMSGFQLEESKRGLERMEKELKHDRIT